MSVLGCVSLNTALRYNEPMNKDCLKKRKAVLGDTHPDTLNSINNLARLYDLAEPLYKNCPEKLVDG